jgi:hypothetical protein
MTAIAQCDWVADLRAMKCRNFAKNITVKFEKEGRELVGKLDHVPMELYVKWAEEPDGQKYAIDTVMEEAEAVFLRAYFERKLDKHKR